MKLKIDIEKIKNNPNKNLMEILMSEGITLDSNCGGEGYECGKCKVVVEDKNYPVTLSDIKNLISDEIANGYRLACKIYPQSEITLILPEEKREYEILSEIIESNCFKNLKKDKQGYAVVIDLGTTTLVLRVYNLNTGEFIAEGKKINPQIVYGSDVITRIEQSKKHLIEMRDLIRETLNAMLDRAIESLKLSYLEMLEVVISGNTTMAHLLLGLSVESIGVYPFTPLKLDYSEENLKEIFPKLEFAEFRIIPGISSFVGGDITSGIYYSQINKSKDISLLLDLGTNGELVIGNEKNIYVTSTAAGPAFEGGNIQWGIGSVSGAICSVEHNNGFIYKTIDNKEAIGICGTGLIDILSILIEKNLVDETGLLTTDEDKIYIKEKEIYISQKDIREFQLAKSAIRTGIELLIKHMDVNYDSISNVYLSGGFGMNVNIGNFIKLGIIPKCLENRIKLIGNSSLGGALKSVFDIEYDKEIENIKLNGVELNLAENILFNDYFVKYMYFSEEKYD